MSLSSYTVNMVTANQKQKPVMISLDAHFCIQVNSLKSIV